MSFLEEVLNWLSLAISNFPTCSRPPTHVCEKISSQPRPDTFRSLPKFITNPEEKFLLSEDIERLLFEAQNRRDLLSLIDGERSLSELADLISKHSNISKESALENLLLFFTPLFEHEIK
jgi:hypothetical protein